MKILALSATGGLSLAMGLAGALATAVPAQAANDSVSMPGAAGAAAQTQIHTGIYAARQSEIRMGSWQAGLRAPGGYAAYRRPFRGFVLPTYWHNREFYVTDYRMYNLRAPQQGTRWSRYYDDAVLTDGRGYVYDSVQGVDWDRAAYQGTPYDSSVLTYGDRVYGGDRTGTYERSSGSYDGTWEGTYADDDAQVYQGQWNGTYVDENGQAYRGQWTGTYEGSGYYEPIGPRGQGRHVGADYDDSRYDDRRYDNPRQGDVRRRTRSIERDYSRYGADAYERCRRDNGVGGAIIGGALGGLAGNRIAGRGSRTEGTLIGAGVGAIAGAVIDQAEDRDLCARYASRGAVGRRTAPRYGQRAGGGYISGGYYYPPQQQYYYPQPQVTTIVINADGETTTTTTTSYDDGY